MTNDELQALCDAATPGPWYSHNPDDEMHMNAYAVSTSPIEPCVDTDERINDRAIIVAITLLQTPRVACTSDGRYEQNAAFIAAARTAIPELLAENARLARELNDATNRIETQMHQLNDAQRESVSLGLRLETAERDQRLLVQLWNAMAHTEQGWRVFVDGDLLREFEQAVLNE